MYTFISLTGMRSHPVEEIVTPPRGCAVAYVERWRAVRAEAVSCWRSQSLACTGSTIPQRPPPSHPPFPSLVDPECARPHSSISQQQWIRGACGGESISISISISSSSSSSIVMVKHWLTIDRWARSGRERRSIEAVGRPGPGRPIPSRLDRTQEAIQPAKEHRGAVQGSSPALRLACRPPTQLTCCPPACPSAYFTEPHARSLILDLVGSADCPSFPTASFFLCWRAPRVLPLLPPFSGAGTVPPLVDRRLHGPAAPVPCT
jgi:hypothetical protein